MLKSISDIETVPFAEGWLARNLKNGSLCRLNATAGAILERFGAGGDEIDAARALSDHYGIGTGQARADVTAILQAWRQSGLIETPDSANTTPKRADGNTGTDGIPPPASDSEPGPDMIVACGGPSVRVRCRDAELADLLAAAMAPALLQPDEMPGPEQTLDLTGREGDYQCWCDGALLWRFGPRPWARRFLLQDVINRSLPCGQPGAILHASAVLLGGQAVILAGKSGSGKSTLAAGLVAAGGQLIADDLLPLADGEIWPVPFAISLKQGSWPALAHLFAGLDRQKIFTSRGMKVRYLAPAAAEAGHSARPAVIIFPAWDAGQPARTVPLDANAIADGLIETGTDLHRIRGALADFAALASSTPGYRIQYPTLDAGIEWVV